VVRRITTPVNVKIFLLLNSLAPLCNFSCGTG
jgi:hypothetical protein